MQTIIEHYFKMDFAHNAVFFAMHIPLSHPHNFIAKARHGLNPESGLLQDWQRGGDKGGPVCII